MKTTFIAIGVFLGAYFLIEILELGIEAQITLVLLLASAAFSNTLATTSSVDSLEKKLFGLEQRAATADEPESAGISDELYEQARAVVIEVGKVSTSYLQRKLKIGYARSAELMDILEERVCQTYFS